MSEITSLFDDRRQALERLRSLAFGVINQAAEGALTKERKVIECSWAALASWAREIRECCDILEPDIPPAVEHTAQRESRAG